jgi:hypothetical protein
MHLFDFFIVQLGVHAFLQWILPLPLWCRHVLGWEVEHALEAISVTSFIAHRVLLGAVLLEAVNFLLSLTELSL